MYYDRLIQIYTLRVLWQNDYLNTVRVLWQTVTPQYCLSIMADRYTSIQSVCYGRLIHINTACVLWQTDTPQYSLCFMADRYTSIVCVLWQLHLNTVCVLW